jgi:glutathione peroxidase
MFSKIAVTGDATHPLYREMIVEYPKAEGAGRDSMREKLSGFLAQKGLAPNPEPGVLWNFEKFLIGRDGRVVARFSPEITPDDPQIVTAVEKALSAS